MKKVFKYIWILPIIVATLFVGVLFFPNKTQNSFEEFQTFAKAYQKLISSQDEIENFDGIKLNLSNDLTCKNGTYLIDGEHFAKITNSQISYNKSGEFKITHQDKIVSLYNNSNTIKINSADIDIMRESSIITNSNSQIPIEDVAKSLGFDVSINKDTMTLTRPFITKRLMVYTNETIDDFGAIAKVEGYNDLHIFQYDTETKAEQAYHYYQTLQSVDSVEIDTIVTPTNYDEESLVTPLGLDDSFSYSSWGADAMGIETYSQYLKTQIGTDDFPELIVAVLDTGIDSDHPWFSGRIFDEKGANFSSSSNDITVYEDVFGHGTHVSGIIADLTFSNVKILPIKVMNDNGYGFASAIKAGIDYVNELKDLEYNIIAMNLSLGTVGSVGSTNYTSFQTKIDTAYNKGILSVVAAGNDGTDCISNAPANISSAITVSAVSVTGGDVYFRPTWSNYGSYVDVCAPGGYIKSASVGGGTKYDSGTSMAAPHIAAAIALLYTDAITIDTLQENKIIKYIEDLLDNSAIDLGDTGWDQYYGEGLVNIEHANATIIEQVTFSNTTTDHTEAFELTLSTNTPNAKIYYTINNDKPSIQNGIEYTLPLYIAGTQKISAIAYVFDGENIVGYSKIRTVMYCFYGEDIDDAYTVDNNGTLIAYTGGFVDITIPKVVNGITVTTIGESAFANTDVERITLPSSVTTIDTQAFFNCVNLQYIYAPSVTTVGLYSFAGCSKLTNLTDEYFPKLKIIDKYAFSHCYLLQNVNLTNVILADSYCFYMNEGTSPYLNTITMPSATIIGKNAFINCSAITTISLPSAQIISSGAFENCNITNELNLPALKFLGSRAFFNNKNITSVIMPKVQIIGSQCFYNYCTNITSVDIPNATIVGSKAFSGCSQITSLNVSKLEEAYSEAFNNLYKLSTIELPRLQYAGKKAFYALSNITSLELPNIINLSAYAFGNTPLLKNVYLPSSIEYIDSMAFKDVSNICKFHIYGGTVAEDFVNNNGYYGIYITETDGLFTYTTSDNEIYITGINTDADTIPTPLVIPSFINSLPVTKICASAFQNNTNIQNLNLSKLKTIEEFAFVGCKNLKSITLNSIETIERNAFENCTSLNEVNIYSAKTIQSKAFYNCESLLSIKLSKNTIDIGEKSLGYIKDDKIIPTFAIYSYTGTAAETYAKSLNITFHAIFSNITSFYYDYYDNNGLKEITITHVDGYTTGSVILPSAYNGYTISKISEQAFMNCSFITGIKLPSTIKTIEQYAFANCSLLEEINLEYVKNIGEAAFYACSSLINVNLEHLTEIPVSCFNSCEKIKTLNIPNVTKINSYAFTNCYDLHTVVSPNLQHIERQAFESCSNLQYIDTQNIIQLGTIVDNTTHAGNVFNNCEKIKVAYFPKLQRVASAIFSNTLQKVVVGDSLYEIYGRPFLSPVTIYGYAGSKIIVHAINNNISYQIIDKLSIINDVVSSSNCYRFNDLSLEIETTGFEQKYQWYSTPNTTENGTAIIGATSNILSVNTDNVGAVNYYAIVTDWNGDTLTSNICKVNVFGSDSTYIISVGESENGETSKPGNNYVNVGSNFSITFNPNPGCYIESLIIDGTPLTQSQIQSIVNNNYTYTFNNVNTDHTVEVSYASASFTISVIQAEYGTISVAKDSYEYGTSAYFSLTPINGYYVEHIIVDGNIVDNTTNSLNYVFSNINANHTISAKFSPRNDIEYKVKHYKQSLTNSGDIYYDGLFYKLDKDNIETLTGTTNTLTDAHVQYYVGFYSLYFSNTNILPDGSTTINIFYNRESYSVSLFKGKGISSISGNGTYLYGQEITITAEVNSGYTFEKWTSGNENFYESSTSQTYTFTIENHNADFTATAVIQNSSSEDDNNNQDENEPNDTPDKPDDSTDTNTNTPQSSGGGGAAIGIIAAVIGGAILIVVIVLIKKSRNRRF